MTGRRIRIYFDGGARPNPGPMEAAVVVRGAVHIFDDLGTGSNSDAEWLALIRALELARSMGFAGVDLIGDALQVVRQANRALAGSEPATGHAAAFRELAAAVRPRRIRWVKRAQNLAGAALAARHPR